MSFFLDMSLQLDSATGTSPQHDPRDVLNSHPSSWHLSRLCKINQIPSCNIFNFSSSFLEIVVATFKYSTATSSEHRQVIPESHRSLPSYSLLHHYSPFETYQKKNFKSVCPFTLGFSRSFRRNPSNEQWIEYIKDDPKIIGLLYCQHTSAKHLQHSRIRCSLVLCHYLLASQRISPALQYFSFQVQTSQSFQNENFFCFHFGSQLQNFRISFFISYNQYFSL